MHLVSDAYFQSERLEGATRTDLRLENCSFDNCSARNSRFERLQLIGCGTWSCHLYDLVVEDCLFGGIKTTVSPGGGKRAPLLLWGVRVKHVVLEGRIGSLLWNPPHDWPTLWPAAGIAECRAYYTTVDWALDISSAEFTSVPSFRFGPPGHLIRRDPETQPIVTRERARAAAWESCRATSGSGESWSEFSSRTPGRTRSSSRRRGEARNTTKTWPVSKSYAPSGSLSSDSRLVVR